MMRRHSLTASATLLGVLLMAGCSGSGGTPTSVALSEAQGLPPDAPVSEPWNDPDWRGEPLAWVSDEGETLTVVTFGSSSCPFIAVRIEMLTARQLAIDFEKGPAEACTDDLAPRTHVFAVPEGVDAASAGLEVEVSLADTAFGPAEPTVESVPILPLGSAAPDEPAEEPVDSIALEVIRGTPADIELDDEDLASGDPLAFWGEARGDDPRRDVGQFGLPADRPQLAARRDGRRRARLRAEPCRVLHGRLRAHDARARHARGNHHGRRRHR
ncbi:MAG: hypothetical protein ACJLS2_10180 [Microcella pacifica]